MMNTRVAVGGLVVLLLVVGTVAAFATGFGPAPGGDTGDDLSTPRSTGTVYEDDGSSTSGGDTSGDGGDETTQSLPPFAFGIDSIDKCGETCRDVTATITNQQNETATSVTVYTRIYAGNSTDSGDRIWSGNEQVGTLEANGSYTSTKRVELSLLEARQVQNNGGWITVLTTVESDEMTVTFKSRRDVA